MKKNNPTFLVKSLIILSWFIPSISGNLDLFNSKLETFPIKNGEKESENMVQNNLVNLSEPSSTVATSKTINHEIRPYSHLLGWNINGNQNQILKKDTQRFDPRPRVLRQNRFIELNQVSLRKDTSTSQTNYIDSLTQNERTEPRILSIFSVISFSNYACQGRLCIRCTCRKYFVIVFFETPKEPWIIRWMKGYVYCCITIVLK